MYGREFVRPRTKGGSLAGSPKCQSRLRPLEMELGRSDLTAPFTVDQACQGPLKQHKWGLVSLCQSMHNTEVRRYKGTKAPSRASPSFRGRARLGGRPRNWVLWPAHGLSTDGITVLAVRAQGPAKARLDFFDTHRQNKRRE